MYCHFGPKSGLRWFLLPLLWIKIGFEPWFRLLILGLWLSFGRFGCRKVVFQDFLNFGLLGNESLLLAHPNTLCSHPAHFDWFPPICIDPRPNLCFYQLLHLCPNFEFPEFCHRQNSQRCGCSGFRLAGAGPYCFGRFRGYPFCHLS